MAGLRLDGVALGYGQRLVLDDISFEVAPGEVVGVVGPNGCGKSTLLKAASGVLAPWRGSIAVNGSDVRRLSRPQLARLVAVVPQNPTLPETFTALELALMGRYPHLGRFGHEGRRDLAIALDALAQTGLSELASRRVGELSGGERQRLVVARALAQSADGGQVLLLDEPTAHLDVPHQLAVMGLVQGLAAQGLAALAAVHDLALAARFCDRLLLVGQGRIVADGPPEAVVTSQNLARVFGIDTVVYREPFAGRLAVTPLPRRERDNPPRIHVIGGGGCGARLLRLLYTEGFALTAGVLNEGDTDLAVARALGVDAIAIPAFAAIDDDSHRRHLEFAAAADCVVVADVPFGQANLRNLEAAAANSRLILVEETPIAERDFVGGRAVALHCELRPRATTTTYRDLLAAVEAVLSEAAVGTRA